MTDTNNKDKKETEIEMLARIMMNRFDRIDERFDFVQEQINGVRDNFQKQITDFSTLA